MTSAETPAAPSPKSSGSGWQKSTVTILGIAFWIMLGAAVTFALKKPKQDLLITNTGSQTVDVRNASEMWPDNKVLTLHPGMSGFWMFRDGDQFRITRSVRSAGWSGPLVVCSLNHTPSPHDKAQQRRPR